MSSKTIRQYFCLIFSVLICLGGNYSIVKAGQTTEIHYPRNDAKTDPNEAYIQELLHLAVQNSPRTYTLSPTKAKTQQGRAIYEMTRINGTVNLTWTMTTDERERMLIPIRIPIDKGLLGWRVPLITAKNRLAFAGINSIEQLQKFSAGQGHDWPDVQIMKANQLPVYTSNAYDSLFAMLAVNRFDYFPRSIFEILPDLEAHSEYGLEVDQHIVLHYITACYFFVSPHQPQMAEDLRIGLEKIIANGQFEKLFQKHHRAFIEKLKIKQRHIIHLQNPLLNEKSMPMNRTELWFYPQ
ncbi:MAG: hypothetical protein K2P84_09375 [Undibacterium sp.]|nr:hypothetical protein [Undibacterium sp.]